MTCFHGFNTLFSKCTVANLFLGLNQNKYVIISYFLSVCIALKGISRHWKHQGYKCECHFPVDDYQEGLRTLLACVAACSIPFSWDSELNQLLSDCCTQGLLPSGLRTALTSLDVDSFEVFLPVYSYTTAHSP